MDETKLTTESFRTVWTFFVWVFLVSIPFWVIGAFWKSQFLPRLPISALMVIVPVTAGACFVYRTQGTTGVQSFLAQAFDARKLNSWSWCAVLFTMPVVMVLSALLQCLLGESILGFRFNLIQAFALFCIFFIAGTAEELGWTGFAAKPLITSLGTLSAGLIIGLIAALWHVFPLLQADRAWDWIAWWFAATISRRILIVWVYEHGGQSIFGASLFHAMSNLSWMLFPVMGSHYDPMIVACMTVSLVAVTLTISRFKRLGAG